MIERLVIKSPNYAQTLAPAVADFNEVKITRRVNRVGLLDVVLPWKYLPVVQKDTIIEVWRRPGANRALANRFNLSEYLLGNTLWVVRQIEIIPDTKQIALKCYHALSIANRRLVAQYSSIASATNVYADDLMKSILTAQQTDHLFAGEIPRSFNNALTIDAASSAGGALISKDYAWRENLIDLFVELSDKSQEAGGKFIAFDVVVSGGSDAAAVGQPFLSFRTFPGQRGADRTRSSALAQTTPYSPVILSPATGNVQNLKIVYDYSNEATVLYAAGQGQETARTVKYARDETREGTPALRPFGLIERYENVNNVKTPAAVQSEADSLLLHYRGTKAIRGDFVEGGNYFLGPDLDLGDKVTLEATYEIDLEDDQDSKYTLNATGDVSIEAYQIKQAGGNEEISVVLESGDFI
jgi:hypothetical protein